MRHVLDPIRAAFSQDACPYCGQPVHRGDPIDRAYLRVGWGRGWAEGRCGYFNMHQRCAREADARRLAEPPLSAQARDEVRSRAGQATGIALATKRRYDDQAGSA